MLRRFPIPLDLNVSRISPLLKKIPNFLSKLLISQLTRNLILAFFAYGGSQNLLLNCSTNPSTETRLMSTAQVLDKLDS
jgi:hypothetical protein